MSSLMSSASLLSSSDYNRKTSSGRNEQQREKSLTKTPEAQEEVDLHHENQEIASSSPQASGKNHDDNDHHIGLLALEKEVRNKLKHSPVLLLLINGYSSFLIFALHLISLESLLSIALSVTITIVVYYQVDTESSSFDGGIMDWVLLSFAVVTPMSSSIGMAFTRREKALAHMATIRATLLGLYGAHASWDWKSGQGRSTSANVDSWLHHSDNVLRLILQLQRDVCRVLTLPNAQRARHRITQWGRRESHQIHKVSRALLDDTIVSSIARVSQACEVLKREGLPPNEATRIRQWERMVMEQIEGLRMIKHYRTPQALRSLCRLFSIFLPPFYAPYYAEMARSMNNTLGMGVAFSVLTSLALTALFESLSQMEDPFLAHLTLDGIDVPRELQTIPYRQLLSQRNQVYFPGAPPFLVSLDRNDNGQQQQQPAEECVRSDNGPSDLFSNARIFGDSQ